MKVKSTGGRRGVYGINTCVWEYLAMDQTDLWQVVPRQALTPHDCLLISGVFVVLCRIGCMWVTGVFFGISANHDIVSIYSMVEKNILKHGENEICISAGHSQN